MFKLNFTNSYKHLIVFAIVLTPIFGISEVISLISETLKSQTTALTSVYIKGLKDIVLIVIMLIGTIEMFVRRKVILNKPYTAFIALVALSALLSINYRELLTIAAGLRWILPVAIFPFIYRSVDTDLQDRIAKWMIILFFLGLSLQIAELFLIKGWFGWNIFGLSKRNPGFYLIPSSMACFSALTVYYTCFYCKNTFLRRSIVFFLAPVSILLTASATGYFAMFLFWMYLLYNRVKQKGAVVITVATLLAVVLVFLPTLTGRDDIYTSILTRNEILLDVVKPERILISAGFGDATNTGVLLNANKDESDVTSFVADSTVNSIIYNSGLISLLIFIIFLFNSVKYNATKANISFFIIISPFMLTTILFELFPANLLLMVNVAFFYNSRNYQLRQKRQQGELIYVR